MIKDNIFRGYDIRGTYPEELNEDAVYWTTRAFCDLYPASRRVVLARDPRPSSPALAEAARRAFLEAGRVVIDLGIAPDPLWYFAIMHYGYDGGLMIPDRTIRPITTASLTTAAPAPARKAKN